MSCYRPNDQISYRLPKRRARNGGYTIFTGTVIRYIPETDTVKVRNHALGCDDLVPMETITMHQPQLDAA